MLTAECRLPSAILTRSSPRAPMPLTRLLLCIFATSIAMAAQTSNSKFAQLTDEFVKASLALSPVTASSAGYHDHIDPKSGKSIHLDAQLDDASPQAVAAQVAFYRTWRDRFQKETPVSFLNPEDAADFRLIDDQIAVSLLEFEQIQNYKHNPTVYVELIGNALFLPLTQNYASKEIRLADVLSRTGQIPRYLDPAKAQLIDPDPIFISTATDENEGNLNLINSVAAEISAGSP